jgi:hypothetical protein
MSETATTNRPKDDRWAEGYSAGHADALRRLPWPAHRGHDEYEAGYEAGRIDAGWELAAAAPDAHLEAAYEDAQGAAVEVEG